MELRICFSRVVLQFQVFLHCLRRFSSMINKDLLLKTKSPLLEHDRVDAAGQDLSLKVDEHNQLSCYYILEGRNQLASKKLLYGLRNEYQVMDKFLLLWKVMLLFLATIPNTITRCRLDGWKLRYWGVEFYLCWRIRRKDENILEWEMNLEEHMFLFCTALQFALWYKGILLTSGKEHTSMIQILKYSYLKIEGIQNIKFLLMFEMGNKKLPFTRSALHFQENAVANRTVHALVVRMITFVCPSKLTWERFSLTKAMKITRTFPQIPFDGSLI